MSILTVAKTLVTLLPIISEVITAVEAISQAGTGAAKKKLVLDTIKTLYDASQPAVPFDTLKANIETVVDSLVAYYNTIGVFVKTLKQAA